jgi:hypothetical protein
MAKSSRNNPRAWIVKVPEADGYQWEIHDEILKSTWQPDPEKVVAVDLEVYYLFPIEVWRAQNGNLKRIDISNLMKVVEDGIVKATQVDDKFHVSLKSEKCLPLVDEEGLYQIIVKMTYYMTEGGTHGRTRHT